MKIDKYFKCPNCGLKGGHSTYAYVKIRKKFKEGYSRIILKKVSKYFICQYCQYTWT